MEKKRSPLIPIILAAVIGVLTVLLLNGVIRPSPLVVARVAIAPGTVLTAELLEVRTIPAGARPADGFETIEAAAGQVLAVQRAPGDAITAAVLGGNALAGIPAQLASGHVAIAVQVDLAGGVAGLLRPGQSVALIGLLEPDVLGASPSPAILIPAAPGLIDPAAAGQASGTPTPTATAQPPLGPLGRIVITGIRVLMVPQSFQYQEIPAGASQEELFASSAATHQATGVVVLDVPTAGVNLAPGLVVNPATLIAALDRFGSLTLALEPGGGLDLPEGEIRTLNLAGLYQALNQPPAAATPTMHTRPPATTSTPTPGQAVPTAFPTLTPRP